MLSRSAARSLNVRTLEAHTGVSMLGKMLRTTRCPSSSPSDTEPRSDVVSVKSGASDPTAGSSPLVAMGLPRKVTWAMGGVPSKSGSFGTETLPALSGVEDTSVPGDARPHAPIRTMG